VPLPDLPIVRVVSAWLILGSLAVAAPGEEVRWRGDYAAARAEATRLGRPIVIVVTSEGCVWCRRLEQTTLRDDRVIRALNESTIPLRLDADDPAQAALVKAMRVEGVPTIAAVTPRGRVVANRSGYLDAAQFLRLLKEIRDEEARPKLR
jgi:thioredoxin-related protein